jgi:probable phosphoglycerate mutase
MPRTTIHLIRHADAIPELGAELDAAADYDALGLSRIGRAQAAALARRVAAGRSRPAAIYASPTRRANETAATLAGALDLDVVLDSRLREIHLGLIGPGDDTPTSERSRLIRARLAELAAIALRDGSWRSIPEAEPAACVRARMSAAVEAAVERHRGGHVALVSHAGAINAYLAGIVGTPRDFFFLTGNTSLSSVRFVDGTVSLVRLNDTAHLEVTRP